MKLSLDSEDRQGVFRGVLAKKTAKKYGFDPTWVLYGKDVSRILFANESPNCGCEERLNTARFLRDSWFIGRG